MPSTSVETASPLATTLGTDPSTPLERVLTASLVLAPLMYLAADTTYAARGWSDPTAGVLHVLAAIAYGLVVLRVATWLPRNGVLLAAIVVTGLVGMAGSVA